MPIRTLYRPLNVVFCLGLGVGALVWAQAPAAPPATGTTPPIATVPGMPAVVDPANLYSETTPEN